MTSWMWSLVTYYLRYTVSEIKRFYCQPDMMSSSVLRQGALKTLFHEGFWKSDHNFLIAFHSKFYLRCMISKITRFYCKPNMTSSWFLRQGALHAILDYRFWKGDPDFILVLYCNYTSIVHRFRFNLLHVCRKWRHNDFVTRGRFRWFLNTDSERVTPTSYSCSLDTFCLTWKI